MGEALCPLCNARMVKEYSDTVALTNPPIYSYRWWCRCGARGHWEDERQRTDEERLRISWEAANDGGR
jgi:hypothetical protein